MPDYEYHIFISYRRMDNDWICWTRDCFKRPLETLLRPALGNIRIFFDEQIETGSSWPLRLATAHARSQIMIPILCRDYFNSDWCRLELALMYEREQKLNYRSIKNPEALILPFIIDDGDCFPIEIQAIQSESIHKFANPFMRKGTPSHANFAERLRTCCGRIENAIQSAPPFDPAWENENYDHFKEMFRIKLPAHKIVPSLSLLTSSVSRKL